MSVAPWEYWTVAQMLVSTHGPDAETVAANRLDEALEQGHSGNIIVWKAIQIKLAEIRAAAAPLDPQP